MRKTEEKEERKDLTLGEKRLKVLIKKMKKRTQMKKGKTRIWQKSVRDKRIKKAEE